MTINPVKKSVTVSASPERAFELFTEHTAKWWKEGQSSGNPWFRDFRMEPHAGGKWTEVKADGKIIQWGKVLEWQPGKRLLLAWQLNSSFAYDPEFVTEVDISFVGSENGHTKVTLEHRNLERFGEAAQSFETELDKGWLRHLTSFADYVKVQK